MNIKTYNKTPGALFDYSSNYFKEINTILDNGTYLTRKDDSIIRVEKQSNIESKRGEELLFYIRMNKNDIFSLENPVPMKNIPISNDNINNLNNKIWYVLNSNNPNFPNGNEDYFLSQSDIIKIGNIRLYVQDIHIKDKQENQDNIIKDNNLIKYDINLLNKNGGPIFNFYPGPKKYYISFDEIKDKDRGVICNFCTKKECNIDDPIITFCDCKTYYHFKCLKESLKKRIKKKENVNKTVKNYYIKGLYCEECKANFPLKFKITESEKTFELIDIIKPEKGNYLILESLDCKIYYGSIKLVFVIELLNENEITIGRKKENDITICDPSISKEHAEISYRNGNILIKNKNSKYGTLILVKKPIKINDKLILIQIGRTIIEARQMRFGEFDKMKLKNVRRHLPKKD